LIFKTGGETHRQVFPQATQLWAVLEMGWDQGANEIELLGNSDTTTP
jgi:hypothetical protein